jgi:hypothetical protein
MRDPDENIERRVPKPQPRSQASMTENESLVPPRFQNKVIAEGLTIGQAQELLLLLYQSGQINTLGTPSRAEVITPPSKGSGGMVATGGILNSPMMAQLSIETLASLKPEKGLYDVSKISFDVVGAEEILPDGWANVGRIYEADPQTPAMDDEAFAALLAQFGASRLKLGFKFGELTRPLNPDHQEPLSRDLGLAELRIRLTSLAKNNRIHGIATPEPSVREEAEQLPEPAHAPNSSAIDQDVIDRHLARLTAGDVDGDLRYKLSLNSYENPPGLQGLLVVAHVTSFVTTTARPDPEDLVVQNSGVIRELVAENLDIQATADALCVLWEDGKLDLFTCDRSGGYAVSPVGLKDELGAFLSPKACLKKLVERLAENSGGDVHYDILLGQSPRARDGNDNLTERTGFLVIISENKT